MWLIIGLIFAVHMGVPLVNAIFGMRP